MFLKGFATVVLVQIALSISLSNGVLAQGLMAPSAWQVAQNVTASLATLYATNDAAKTLGSKARAILVFPDAGKRRS